MNTDVLEIAQGDHKNLNFQIIKPDATPQDITGWTFFFAAKLNLTTPDAQADIYKTIGNGGVTIIDALNGIGKISFVPADTSSLPADTFLFWGFRRKDGGGQTKSLVILNKLYVAPVAVETAP